MQEFLPYIELDANIEAFRAFCLQNCYRKELVHKGEHVVPPENDVCGFLHKGCLKVFFSTENGSERLIQGRSRAFFNVFYKIIIPKGTPTHSKAMMTQTTEMIP